MKKLISFINIVVLLTATMQRLPAMTMSMTTESNKITIYMAGSGVFSINWGDGTKSETRTLFVHNEDDWNLDIHKYSYSHDYSGISSRYITIVGVNITHLFCSDSQLTSLDVSKNTALNLLWCHNNQLTVLDVSQNIALTRLVCSVNQLTHLDISQNTLLSTLICKNNQLTSLDVSQNSALLLLNCTDNQLNTDALDILFGTLHNNKVEGKCFFISNNPGIKTCNRNIVLSRGWAEEGYRFSTTRL